MPVMNGPDAARLIKAQSGDQFVPVIFLTGRADEETLAECMEPGGDDFLTKPVNNVVLAAKLESWLRIRALTETIRDPRNALQEIQAESEREMQIAEKVFSKMVKGSGNVVRNVKSHVSAMSILSGDVLLRERTPTGAIRVMLGDFTGHGLSAAIGAPQVCDLFFSMTEKGFSVAEVVGEVNRKLVEFLPTGRFLACTFLELELEGGRLTYWNGGMPPFLVRSEEGSIRFRGRSTNLPLGVVGGDALDATTRAVTLEIGDRVLAYSDGAVEALNAKNEMFGEARLEALYCDELSADAFERIPASLAEFVESGKQTDDITLVEIVRSGEAHPASHANSEMTVRKSATHWETSILLEGDTLRDYDPLPLLIHIPVEVQGLRAHRERIYTILAELYSNALDHGLLGLESELKKTSEGFTEYYKSRESRLANLSRDDWIRVHLVHAKGPDGGCLSISVHDSGPGFEVRDVSVKASDDRAKSGRGISLVKEFCTEVRYNERGNSVTAKYEWAN